MNHRLAFLPNGLNRAFRLGQMGWLRLFFTVLPAIIVASMGMPARGQNPPVKPGDLGATGRSGSVAQSLAEADQSYRSGKLDEAAEEYKRVLQGEPGSAAAYVGLARIYLKQNRTAEAYAAADKAYELAPGLDTVRVLRGEIFFRQGKINEAEKEFTDLIKAGTTLARADLGLARVYKAKSYYEHAKIAIDRAYQLDSTDPDIVKERFGYLSLADRIKGLRLYMWGNADDGSKERRDMASWLAALEQESSLHDRPCRPVAPIKAMETRLEPLLYNMNAVRGYGLRVKLNAGSAKLLLDTGASGLVISRKAAERAGVKHIVDTEIRGAGDKGPAHGYIGYVESVGVGELEFRDCYVRVTDSNSITEEEGLIGGDLFSDYLVDIDFPNAKLKLSQLPARPGTSTEVAGPTGAGATGAAANSKQASEVPRFHDRYVAPEMKTFTPILRFGHDLLLWTQLNDLPPKLFVLDTGAFANIISPSAAAEVTKVSSDSSRTVKGINGAVKDVFRADEFTLKFANLRQKSRDVVALDTTGQSASIGTEISGFLGFAMLRVLEIKIDYRDGLIDFEYNPNRLH